MQSPLITTIAVILTVLAADAVWLTSMSSFYKASVFKVQHKDMRVRLAGAIVAYAAVAWLLLDVALPNVRRALASGASLPWASFRHAGLLGLGAYAIYNATSYAIYEGYDGVVAVADTLWGTFLFSLVAFVAISVERAAAFSAELEFKMLLNR